VATYLFEINTKSRETKLQSELDGKANKSKPVIFLWEILPSSTMPICQVPST
jgi:hypothetical protein